MFAGKSSVLLLLVPVLAFSGFVKQDYFFDSPEIQDNTVCMNGCHPYYADFVPSIPAKTVHILLPEGETAVSFEVTCGDPIEISGRFAIKPYRPELRIGRTAAADFFSRKAPVYQLNRFFPAGVNKGGFDVHYIGGHPVFIAQINPVQYNPVTGVVRYYRSISVSVKTAPDNFPANVIKTTPEIRSHLSKMVDNPQGVSKFAPTEVHDADYEYLIITTGNLLTSFDNFIAFNTRRGMRTKVISTSDAAVTGQTGVDIQEKIRSYIKTQYDNFNIQYVLLAGDAEASSAARIPHRGLFSEDWDYNYTGKTEDHYTDNIPADMYFGWLGDATGSHEWKGTTTWGGYGTEDIFPEVAVGRFPVDNASELAIMINKTIKYSESPVESLCTRAVLSGEYLWSRPGGTPCYGDDEMAQIIDSCNVSYGATGDVWKTGDPYTQGFPSAKWTYKILGEKTGQTSFSTFSATVRQYKAAIINHEGHSNATYLFRGSISNMTSAAFPNACTPTTGNYFIAMSGGCYPGAFDNNNLGTIGVDCVAEHLTKGLSTGAVCCIFNSRYGFGSDGTNGVIGTDGSEQKLRRFFHHGLFGKGIHNIGKTLDYSKWANAGDWTSTMKGWTNPVITGAAAGYPSYWGQLKWETYEKNLLGDPALSIWTDAPKAFASSVLPSTLTSATFTVQVPRYSTVALATPAGMIFTSVTSGDEGTCTINNNVLTKYLQTNPNGQIKVYIKAHNYLPFTGTVQCNINSAANHLSQNPAIFSACLNRQVLSYNLPAAGYVTIELFNARGVTVRSIAKSDQAGRHQLSFENRALPAGMYCCRLAAGGKTWDGRLMITQ